MVTDDAQQDSGKRECGLDLVICIDVTGSMHQAIRMAKENAFRFAAQMDEEMEKSGRSISEFRVKVLAFRDIYVEKEEWIQQSGFFNMRDAADVEAFAEFVGELRPHGGGDEPESAMEALYAAMQAEWTEDGRRHVIVMITDASAHSLESEKRLTATWYPEGIPGDDSDLKAEWSRKGSRGESLVIFAPDVNTWTEIAADWPRVVYHSVKSGEGLEDISWEEIVAITAGSFQN